MIAPRQPQPQPFRLALRVEEAADALGISTRTLMQMVAENQIPFSRIGQRNLRFNLQALQKWLDSKTVMATDTHGPAATASQAQAEQQAGGNGDGRGGE